MPPSEAAVQAEIDRINSALSDLLVSPQLRLQLYAARTAMDWMRNGYLIAPYDSVLGAQKARDHYLVVDGNSPRLT